VGPPAGFAAAFGGGKAAVKLVSIRSFRMDTKLVFSRPTG